MRERSVIFSAAGFTLVELSIVLVIVALLVGGMLVSLGAQQDIRNISETTRQLDETRDALIGFAVANGRLPRPALSSTDGTERAVCADDTECTGFIPWQALGTRKADSWGKLIRYSVSPAFANSAFTLATVATKKIQSRDSAGTAIYLFGQAAACNATDKQCAPAVIFSHGKQRFGTSVDGVAFGGGTATSLDEISNNTGGASGVLFIDRTPADNTAIAGGEFDDLVTWISPNILDNRMISAGKLP